MTPCFNPTTTPTSRIELSSCERGCEPLLQATRDPCTGIRAIRGRDARLEWSSVGACSRPYGVRMELKPAGVGLLSHYSFDTVRLGASDSGGSHRSPLTHRTADLTPHDSSYQPTTDTTDEQPERIEELLLLLQEVVTADGRRAQHQSHATATTASTTGAAGAAGAATPAITRRQPQMQM